MSARYARLIRLVPVALVVLYCADLYYLISASRHANPVEDLFITSDFMPTVVGARLIGTGRGPDLYDLDVQLAEQSALLADHYAVQKEDLLPYNHLPFEALAVTPLQGLPYLLITALWSLLLLACLWAALRLLTRSGTRAPSGALTSRTSAWWSALVALSYYPVFRSLELGQNSVIVLLGLALALLGILKGQTLFTAIGLALVALKPQVYPVVALAALLVGSWRAVLGSIGILAGLSVAAMPLLGWDWPLDYVRLLVGVAGWEQDAINPLIMHNWRGFLEHTVGGVLPVLTTPLYVVLSLLSLLALVLVWRRWRDREITWAMAVLVAVLVSPHLNPHDLTLLIIPGWVLARRGQWTLPVIGYLLAPLGHFLRLGGWWVVASVLLTAAAALLLLLRPPSGKPEPVEGEMRTAVEPAGQAGVAATAHIAYDALP